MFKKFFVRTTAILVVMLTYISLTTTPANASENFGRVRNYSGNVIKIACEYGHMSDTLEEKYPERGSNSTEYCPLDTDQFKAMYDNRCLWYRGPKVKDGWYRLKANAVRKVYGLGKAWVYAYDDSRCGGKPWYNRT